MNRTEKEQQIEELHALFKDVESILLTNPIGTDANTINELRSKCRAEGITFKVVKNTLARRALSGTDKEALGEHFIGPIAVALKAGDPVTPAKVLVDFAKDNKNFELRAGFLSGRILDANGVEQLSEMKGLDELRAELLSLFKAPQTNFVGTGNAMVTKFLRVIKAYTEKLEEAA